MKKGEGIILSDPEQLIEFYWDEGSCILTLIAANGSRIRLRREDIGVIATTILNAPQIAALHDQIKRYEELCAKIASMVGEALASSMDRNVAQELLVGINKEEA